MGKEALTTYSRRQLILEHLRRRSGLSVRELAEVLSVSEGTIRNDLNALETRGHLTRVHGGAILKDKGGFDKNALPPHLKESPSNKMLIVHTAAEMINDGDSIFLDASDNAYYLAQAIQNRSQLRVVTNGLEVGQFLSQNPSNTVMLIGGIVRQDGSSVTGLISEQIVQDLHIQKAFVSGSGFSLKCGLADGLIAEAQIKRLIIGVTQEVIALIDSSMIGSEDLSCFAQIDQIDHLITDTGIDPQWTQLIEQCGITLTICK